MTRLQDPTPVGVSSLPASLTTTQGCRCGLPLWPALPQSTVRAEVSSWASLLSISVLSTSVERCIA